MTRLFALLALVLVAAAYVAGLWPEDKHIAGEQVHVHGVGRDQVKHGAVILQPPAG